MWYLGVLFQTNASVSYSLKYSELELVLNNYNLTTIITKTFSEITRICY